MNGPHIHILVNHAPMIITVLAALALAVGVVTKSEKVQYVGFWGLIILGVSSALAYYSGHSAAHYFVELDALSPLVAPHEQSANVSWLIGVATGVLGAVSIWISLKHSSLRKWAIAASFISLLIVSFYMARTSNLGAQIMHREIRDDSLSQSMKASIGEPDESSNGDGHSH